MVEVFFSFFFLINGDYIFCSILFSLSFLSYYSRKGFLGVEHLCRVFGNKFLYM
jgi:hypothetical protein